MQTIPGTAAPPPAPACIIPRAWRRMLPATCILPTTTTNAFARWTPTASSPRWRATAPPIIPGTAAQPPTRACTIPAAWPWTATATCILPTATTTACARWMPVASSPRWRAMAPPHTRGTAAQPPGPASPIPPAWLWTPSATCTLPTKATTASARWTPTELSAPSRATAARLTPATAARRPTPA